MFRKNEYEILNKMLDEAIGGEFCADAFDESELSKLQNKLMRYLSSASMSEIKLKEEKDKLNELITNISHQTKTPLTNIVMYSELLRESTPNETCREYAEEICSQSRKLEDLIRALVKMARLETEIFQYQKEETKLSEIAEAAVSLTKAKAGEKNIEIRISKEQDARALLDRKWVTEAVVNILDNAVKYSPANSMITISVFKYEIFSGIRIEDQGPGIPEEETAKIFSRFYRGSNARDKEGIGVGLFLSRQILEDHGGYIRVNSEVSKGSTFDVCFPNVSRNNQ